MRIRLVINTEDCSVSAAVLDDVSFEDASRALKKLEAQLGQKIPFKLLGEPEQHSHAKNEIVLDRARAKR